MYWPWLNATVRGLASETKEISTSYLDARLAPMPGAVALLDSLAAAGIPFGVATSSGPDAADAAADDKHAASATGAGLQLDAAVRRRVPQTTAFESTCPAHTGELMCQSWVC